MAKKFSRMLITLAAAGAAVGAGIAYFNRYKKEHWNDDFEDFEDELGEDEKDDTPREYVTIPTPAEENSPKKEAADEEHPEKSEDTRNID